MSRSSIPELGRQLDLIEAIVRSAPDGVDVGSIRRAASTQLGRDIPARTLARRLSELVATGRVETIGQGRATRYRASPGDASRGVSIVAEPSTPDDPEYVPLSSAGEELRRLVRRPIAARRPVGYDDRLLRDYTPGATWYLSEPTRHQLHQVGRTPDGERPAGTFARQVFERLLIDLAWSSSRLEGNTYTRLDTRNLLEFGVRAEGKDAAEAQMILNHKKAIELLVEQADVVGFNRFTLFNLHAALAENLLDDPADEGRLRSRIVGITGTTFVPLSIPQKIEELFDLVLTKAAAIPDPFEQSFFVMVHLPYLQPFADVNKRTSRLAANISLVRENLCPLSFVGVPERAYIEGTIGIYEEANVALLRDVFTWAYERSCAQYRVLRDSLGEPDPVRLRYRSELAELVRDVVRSRQVPRERELAAWGERHAVAGEDVGRFAEIAFGLLVDLHEGGIG
ncbi:MAG: Fic family protein [Gemmatimonadota bacterium]